MKETGTEFSELLLSWYASHKRELPWRGIKNPYYVWLSEVIFTTNADSTRVTLLLEFC